MKRGWNLRKGQPDGDRGRRAGGRARIRVQAQSPVDDSGRSWQQYWGMVGWARLVEEHGREGASKIMADRGWKAWDKEVQAYQRYLAEGIVLR